MKSDFRRIQPVIKQVDLGTLPVAGKYLLDNNTPVYTIEAGSEDLMKLEFIFDAGQVSERVPLVASSTNMMLPEGTRNYNAENLNTTLDFYGTFLGQHADKDNAGISILFITRHLEKIIELCSEIINYPTFPEDEIESLMKKRLQWFMHGQEKVQVVASDFFFEAVFGKKHPYGKRVVPEDFNGISRKLLTDFHKDYYSPQNMTIIVSGKIPQETKELLNRFFGKQTGSLPAGTNNKKRPEGEARRKIRIPRKEAVQSAIRIGSATINKRDPDYPGLKVTDTILGGFFGSRLMKNIREEKGFTYGISSSVVSYNLSGYNLIATEVGKSHTNETIEEVYNEIAKLQKYPVGKEELEVVRNFMLGEMLRMFDGPFALSESFKAAWEFGLDNSYYYRLADKIKTIEPDEILHLANTYYKIDQMYEIVVGPE